MSQIIKLEITNFKNIEHLEIEPGKFNQIVGANMQGKTSVNQAVEFLMAGSTNPDYIRLGEEKMVVKGTWDDGIIATRYLKRREGKKPTTDLKVEQNGMVPKSKQSFLNGMMGIGTFDPREILNPKTRNASIMSLINVRVTKKELKDALKTCDVIIPDNLEYDQNALRVIEQAGDHFYSARTERNRDTKEASRRYEDAKKALPTKPTLFYPDKDYESLCAEKEVLTEKFRGLAQKVKDWDAESVAIGALEESRNEKLQNVKDMESDLKALQEKLDLELTDIGCLAEEMGARGEEQGIKPDIISESEGITNEGTSLANEIQRHNEIRGIEAQQETVDSLGQAHAAAKAKSDALDFAVNHMRGAFKKQVMESADLPIKGLSYDNGQFTIAGRSLDMLSGAEAIIIGLQLTRLKNPNTNIICIDGGESLDPQSYANIQKAVANDDFKYFITKVGGAFENDTDTVILMENGGVKDELRK